MSDFVEFLTFIGKVFAELIKLTFDIVCFCVLLAASIAPWRIPFICASLTEIDDREDFRVTCWAQFGISLIDLVCIPLGIISFPALWRTYSFCRALLSAEGNVKEFYWHGGRRLACFANFWIVLSDIPCIACGIFVHVTLWRVVQFWRSIAKVDSNDSDMYYNAEYRGLVIANAFIVLTDIPCFVAAIFVTFTGLRTYQFYSKIQDKWGKQDDELFYNHRHRVNALKYFCEVTIDVIFVPLFLVILITVYRVPVLIRKMKDVDGMEKRWVCIKQFFLVLWDTPFIIIGLALVLTIWRAPRLVADLTNSSFSAKKKRKRVVLQLLWLIRDIPFFLMFFIILGTLYRAFATIAKLLQLRFKPVDDVSKIRILSLVVIFPEKGGALLKFSASKPAGLTVQNSKMFVIGEGFWGELGNQIGGTVVLIARNMLPLKLNETYFNEGDFLSGEDEVNFAYTFDAQVKRTTLLKKLGRMRQNEILVLQTEMPNQSGNSCVLFSIPVKISELLDSVNTGNPIKFEDEAAIQETVSSMRNQSEPKPFQDAFWTIILTDFAEIVLDVLHLIMFFVCLAAPWRFLALLVVFFEPVQRWSVRVYCKLIDLVTMTRYQREGYYKKFTEQADIFMKDVPGSGKQNLILDCDDGRTYRHLVEPYRFWTKFLLKGASSQKYDKGVFPVLKDYFDREAEELYFRTIIVQSYVEYASSRLTKDEYEQILRQSERLVAESHGKVEEQYRLLQKTKQDLALTTKGCALKPSAICKRDTGESRSIIMSMFMGTMSDLGAIVLLLILIFTFYRAIPTLKDFFKASLWEWKRIVVLNHFRQLLLDIWMVFQILFVTATVYRIIDLWLDILDEADKKSLSGARRAAKRHFRDIFEDIWEFFTFFFVWNFYTFGLAIIVWGIFVPAACLSELLSVFIPDALKKIRRTFAVLFWGALFAFPFIFVLNIVPRNVGENGEIPQDNILLSLQTWVFGYFGIIFFIIVLSLLANSKESNNVKVRNPTTTVSASPQNLNALLMVFLDTFQLIGLIFISVDLQKGGAVGLETSSSVFQFFQKMSEILFFVFDGAFEGIIWFCVGLVGLWFVIICLPVVIEDLLDWKEKGFFQKSIWWNFCASVLSSTLYLVILANLLKPLQCRVGTSAEFSVSVVRFDTSIECWAPGSPQPTLALACMVCLIFYLITSTVLSNHSGLAQMQDSARLDIRYPYLYLMGVQSAKVLLTMIVFLLTDPAIVVIVCTVGACLLLLWTAVFNKLFKTPICSVRWVIVFRVVGMIMFLWTGIVGFVELENGKRETELVDTDILLLVGWGVFIIIGCFVAYRRKWEDNRALQQSLASSTVFLVIQTLTQKEQELVQERGIIDSWHSVRNGWKKAMKNHMHRQVMIAKKTVELEKHIKYPHLTRKFLNNRATWLAKLTSDELKVEEVNQCLDDLANGICLPQIPIPKLFKKQLEEVKEQKDEETLKDITADLSGYDLNPKTKLTSFFSHAHQDTTKWRLKIQGKEIQGHIPVAAGGRNVHLNPGGVGIEPLLPIPGDDFMSHELDFPDQDLVVRREFSQLNDDEKFSMEMEITMLKSECTAKAMKGEARQQVLNANNFVAAKRYHDAIDAYKQALELADLSQPGNGGGTGGESSKSGGADNSLQKRNSLEAAGRRFSVEKSKSEQKDVAEGEPDITIDVDNVSEISVSPPPSPSPGGLSPGPPSRSPSVSRSHSHSDTPPPAFDDDHEVSGDRRLTF